VKPLVEPAVKAPQKARARRADVVKNAEALRTIAWVVLRLRIFREEVISRGGLGAFAFFLGDLQWFSEGLLCTHMWTSIPHFFAPVHYIGRGSLLLALASMRTK
jgi:hypothetical protein